MSHFYTTWKRQKTRIGKYTSLIQLDEEWHFKQKISARVHKRRSKAHQKNMLYESTLNLTNKKYFPKTISQYEFGYGILENCQQ